MELVVADPRAGNVALLDPEIVRKTGRILEDGTPENTRLAMRFDRRYYEAWCEARGVGPCLPLSAEAAHLFIVDHVEGMPEDVERILVDVLRVKADYGPTALSTLRRRIASINVLHALAELPSPFKDPRSRLFMSKAVRAVYARGWTAGRKTALHRELFDRVVDTCDESLIGCRDRALLFFGFSTGGRRRSEISTAAYDRLQAVGPNYLYRLGVTKSSQTKEAGDKPLTGRGAEAMREWLSRSGIRDGRLFRGIHRIGRIEDGLSDKAVSRIVKRRAEMAGLDPDVFGAHSLRSGFMTECGRRKITLPEAMKLSGHATVAVALGYYQAGEGLANAAAHVLD